MTTVDHQAAQPATAIPATAKIRNLPLDELRPSPDNPRHLTDDDPKLRELADSLRTLGQIEPIVVRAVEAGGSKCGPAGEPADIIMDYIILAGERRWRAARIAGLGALECKILACDDRTALEITVVENLQREDLTPLEEARGVRRLLDAGWPVEEIAAHLGKSPAWVTVRAKLTELDAVWTDGLAAGKYAWAGVAHLEQIARLPAEVQREIAKTYKDGWDPPSAAELAREIQERYLHQLSAATWKLDDAALLPAVGACTTCPHRSGHQGVLFADLAGKDRCLNTACWYRKAQALTARKAAELREKHETVVVLVERRDGNPAPDALPKGVAVLESGNGMNECKKSDPGAVPAVQAESGRTVWVRTATHASPEVRKALGAPIKAPRPGAKREAGTDGSSAQIEAARRTAKRLKQRLVAIAAAAEKAKRPGVDDLLRLLVILVLDGQSPRHQATWEAIASTKRSAADDLDAIWEAVREALPSEYEQVVSTALPDLEAVQECERLVGLDPTAQAEKALRDIPEPAKRMAKVPASAKPGSGKVTYHKLPKKPATKAKKAKKATKAKKGAA